MKTKPRTGSVQYRNGYWFGRVQVDSGRVWLKEPLGIWAHDAEGRAAAKLELARVMTSEMAMTLQAKVRQRVAEKAKVARRHPAGRKQNMRYAYNGEQLTITELANLARCSAAMMWVRLRKKKMTPEQAVRGATDTWVRVPSYELTPGVELTIHDLAELAGKATDTVARRIRSGASPLEAVLL